MTKLLFICGKNRLRSPTAEQVFSREPGVEPASAGIGRDSDEPVSPYMLEWADIIFVMERSHLTKLRKRFGKHLHRQRVVCLDIRDDYEYMDPELVAILKRKVRKHLGTVSSRTPPSLG